MIAELIRSEFGLTPVVGLEIEFYLPGISQHLSKEAVVARLKESLAAFPLFGVDAERGEDQYEIALKHSADLTAQMATLADARAAISQAFKPYNIAADYSAKPFAEQPGSGLHIHMHLQNAQGKNVFTRDGDEMYSEFSDPLLHCLGGMLETLNPSMLWLAPHADSYARFVPKSDAPLTVSWGTNNRTVALRLPPKPISNKHIEHRVAGSDADVAASIACVLLGAHHGLTKKTVPPEPIYGDATLPQYKLPRLAESLAQAQELAAKSQIIKSYIQVA